MTRSGVGYPNKRRKNAIVIYFTGALALFLAGFGCDHSRPPQPSPPCPPALQRESPEPISPPSPMPTGKSYTVRGREYHLLNRADGYRALGEGSYYGRRFHGRRTASGARYNMHDYTAAHPTLPFGSLVKVTNLKTKRWVVVRINDRGPFGPGRVIDVSYAAAKKLGMIRSGTARVLLEGMTGKDDVKAGTVGSSGRGTSVD